MGQLGNQCQFRTTRLTFLGHTATHKLAKHSKSGSPWETLSHGQLLPGQVPACLHWLFQASPFSFQASRKEVFDPGRQLGDSMLWLKGLLYDVLNVTRRQNSSATLTTVGYVWRLSQQNLSKHIINFLPLIIEFPNKSGTNKYMRSRSNTNYTWPQLHTQIPIPP